MSQDTVINVQKDYYNDKYLNKICKDYCEDIYDDDGRKGFVAAICILAIIATIFIITTCVLSGKVKKLRKQQAQCQVIPDIKQPVLPQISVGAVQNQYGPQLDTIQVPPSTGYTQYM